MADIAQEIETLVQHVADIGFDRIYRQHVPTKYTPGELVIRFIGDESADETGYHYRINRDYQFVYFAQNELTGVQKASEIQRRLNSTQKLRVKDTDGYMSVGSFYFSPPSMSEGGEVYALIGVLQVQVREAREFAPAPKAASVEFAIRPLFTSDVSERIFSGVAFNLTTNESHVYYKRAGDGHAGESAL